MSLLTQCPACQTYYRVVPDQLRISDGWVKCGNCSDIFDASAQLIEIDVDAGHGDIAHQGDVEPDGAALAPQGDLPASASDALTASPRRIVLPENEPLTQTLQPDQLEHKLPASSDVEDAVKQTEPVWATQQANLEAEADVELDATPYALPQLEFPEDQPANVGKVLDEPQAVRWDDPAPIAAPTIPLESGGQVSEESVTFLDEHPLPSVWQKPLVRGLLRLLALVLLLLLAGQWVYRERDRLAAAYPEIKPALMMACGWLNCEVRPVRQIDALVIDSVTFNKIENDTYRLSFLVKNTSNLPLAYPAVELVLTDAEDQPAYRRVLSSTELGSRAEELAASSDWAVTVALQIDTPAASQRVFGYRLLVFYP